MHQLPAWQHVGTDHSNHKNCTPEYADASEHLTDKVQLAELLKLRLVDAVVRSFTVLSAYLPSQRALWGLI